MRTMSEKQLLQRWCLISILVTIVITCGAGTTTVYLDEHAYIFNASAKLRTPSYDNSWLILKASRSSYPNQGNFKYTVIPPDKAFFENYRIQATIQQFDMNGKRDCPDELVIKKTTGPQNFVYPIFEGCDKLRDFRIDQISLDNSIIFEFKRTTTKKVKFDITLTVARNCYGTTKYDEFGCSNFYCINDDLTCNDRDNCGDDSDETSVVCNRSMVVGFSVAGSIVFIILLSACIFCACKKRAERNTIHGRVLISPTSNVTSGGLYPVQAVTPAINPTYQTISPTNLGYQTNAYQNPYQTTPAQYQSPHPADDLPPPYAPPYPNATSNVPNFPQAPGAYPPK